MTELELFAVCVTMMKSGQRTILMRDDTILAVDAELTRLRGEVERERMQLTACGVAAQCNTKKSFDENLIQPDNPYYSASYSDVLQCVQREMDLRAQVERLTDSLYFERNVAKEELIVANQRESERISERKAIAEAVRSEAERGNQYDPLLDLANRIEKGEVK